jgi:hypothetical protein
MRMRPPMADAQTPGPRPVNASGLPPVVDGFVAVPPVDDVAGAAAVAAVVGAADAEVDAAGGLVVGSGTKEMFTVACLPPASPKESVHESPSAIWAGVGGQGYLAASDAALFPALSVEGHVEMR